MARQFSPMQKRVWELHSSGFSISQIHGMTGMDESFIRATVTGRWHKEKMGAQDDG